MAGWLARRVARRADSPGSGGIGTPPTSRGGAAIAAHVERADGGPAESWFHPRATKSFTGPGPVEAVSLHPLDGHWHLVTHGLTELHAKESDRKEVSGWGFELTFRIGGGSPGDGERPLWAVDFLAAMASYVWAGRHPFGDGHLIDLRGPVRLGTESVITAAVVVQDPVLGVLRGPFGDVQFLQIVGLTAPELELCRAWSPEGVVELLSRRDPLLVTQLDRPDITADPALAAEAAERARTDGSSLHELRVATLQLSRGRRGGATVQMGAGTAAALGPALRRELLADGASFSVAGDDAELRFVVGPEPAWHWTENGLEAVLTPDGVEYVAGLFDGRTGWGRAAEWPGLRFRVVA